MSKHRPLCAAIISCLFAPLLQGAAPELGEVVGDNVYTNCEYRVAAMFPGEPMIRDITYQLGDRSVPAREFYFERDMGLLSVTVTHFADGPDFDQSLLDGAAAAFRSRGEVRFEFEVAYDVPAIPGRQFSIALPDGRLLRAHVYMADHHLYITEATSDPTDVVAFHFEESVSLIDKNGTDLDTNPVTETNTFGAPAGLPSRQYDCSRLYRR
ncbi:MAG: hypothetical protein V3S07_09675 [Micropepsaceae bacterium]